MFNSSVLDIAIGLVLVYLLISVVLTSVSEAIEGILKTRAKDLERALGELFQGDPTMLRDFYNHPLISGLYLGGYRGTPATDATPAPAGEAPTPAAQAAVPDPAGGGHGNLPSYIPREAFSAAVTDLLKDPRGARLKQALDALATRHGVDPAATRRALENWYDGAMDRASGWFKRRTQVRLFILGLAIARDRQRQFGDHRAISRVQPGGSRGPRPDGAAERGQHAASQASGRRASPGRRERNAVRRRTRMPPPPFRHGSDIARRSIGRGAGCGPRIPPSATPGCATRPASCRRSAFPSAGRIRLSR